MSTPISCAEAARQLKISPTYAQQLIDKGRLVLTLESVLAYKALPKNPVGRPRGYSNPRFVRVNLTGYPEAAKYYKDNPKEAVEALVGRLGRMAIMSDNWETADAETLGKLVLQSAEKMRISKTSSAIMHLAANLLLTIAYETNATEVTVAQDGCTYKGQLTGDWVVEARRVKGPEGEGKHE